MIDIRSKQLWRVAVGLAVIGGLLALFNVVQDYRGTGELDWGHLALAVGVPALFYAMARGAAAPRDPSA